MIGRSRHSDANAPSMREAVVLIHGLGEQVRDEVVRSFVGIGSPSPRIFSKSHVESGGLVEGSGNKQSGIARDCDEVFTVPSTLSDRGMNRVYAVRRNFNSSDRSSGTRTDVYELYWAPHYRDTKISSLLRWSGALLRRPRSSMRMPRLVGVSKWRTSSIIVFQILLLSFSLSLSIGRADRATMYFVTAATAAVAIREMAHAWIGNSRSSETIASISAGVSVLGVVSLGVQPYLPAIESERVVVGFVICGLAFAALAVSGWCGLQAMIRSVILAALIVIAQIVWGMIVLNWDLSELMVTLTGPIALALLGLIGRQLSMGVGDAARYFSSSAADYSENREILREAVELIEELHRATIDAGQNSDAASVSYRYARISVVGHSLGSAIAYDAVCAAWRARHMNINFTDREAVNTVQKIGTELARLEASGLTAGRKVRPPRKGQDPMRNPKQRGDALLFEFQVAVSHLFYTTHTFKDGMPSREVAPDSRWILSDLVTIACPLAHAEVLIASSSEDLDARISAGDLYRSPPEPHPRHDNTIEHRYARRRNSIPHHQSLFALTRWTNLFISHDIVGGPLPKRFGLGIDECEVGSMRWLWSFLVLYPHSSYWVVSKREKLRGSSEQSLEKIREVVFASRNRDLAVIGLGVTSTPSGFKAFREWVRAHVGWGWPG